MARPARYTALDRVTHDGVEYQAGDTLQLQDAEAQPLLDAGVIERGGSSRGSTPGGGDTADTEPDPPPSGSDAD